MSGCVDCGSLSTCGCCEGLRALTPLKVENRPGLSAISYRVGRQPEFKRTMLSALSSSDRPALAALKTRDDDDFSIALLDSWAMVTDVLTFYQERIANESYLRTATERLSITELVRALGYELGPGVAASTHLVFSLETAPGYATIESGTKVQSVPGPAEKPQTFETIEEIEARASWNEMRPKLREKQTINVDMATVVLTGTELNLRADDWLLISAGGASAMRRIVNVHLDTKADETTLALATADDVESGTVDDGVYVMRVVAAPFGHNSPLKVTVSGTTVTPGEWPISGTEKKTSLFLDALYAQLQAKQRIVVDATSQSGKRIIHTISAITTEFRTDYGQAGRVSCLTIDGTNGWHDVFTTTSDFLSPLRGVRVFGAPEELCLADVPSPDPVKGGFVSLEGSIDGFEAGHKLLFVGKQARVKMAPNVTLVSTEPGSAELPPPIAATGEDETLAVISVREMPDEDQTEWTLRNSAGTGWTTTSSDTLHPFVAGLDDGPVVSETVLVEPFASETSQCVKLKTPLLHIYDRASLRIFGNVAQATHGETRSEVLGSGDAGQANQRFHLRTTPLTYVPAVGPRGGESTLEVRVNDVLWSEAPSFFGRGPRDRVYITQRDDEGHVTVQFGDGLTGARLPTGHENVTAVYRHGIGLEAEVKAGQLSLLMTRPLGVKDVVNPLAAAGAEDPQRSEDARANAPLTVLTMDRVVSLQDFAYFAVNFSGIAKSIATWTWNGDRRGVLVTVGGEGGKTVGSDLQSGLRREIAAVGDPGVPVQVESYNPMPFKVDAKVQVDAPTYVPAKVIDAVRAALLQYFSYDARSFGQSVALSEVISVIHNVAGVVSVDVDSLYTGQDPSRKLVLVPHTPAPGTHAAEARGADLLTIDPLSLEKVTAQP